MARETETATGYGSRGEGSQICSPPMKWLAQTGVELVIGALLGAAWAAYLLVRRTPPGGH